MNDRSNIERFFEQQRLNSLIPAQEFHVSILLSTSTRGIRKVARVYASSLLIALLARNAKANGFMPKEYDPQSPDHGPQHYGYWLAPLVYSRRLDVRVSDADLANEARRVRRRLRDMERRSGRRLL